jgi:hypothetical protein
VSWSKIPLALRIAVVLVLALAALAIGGRWIPSYTSSERFYLARAGGTFAARCFAAVGLLELAALLRGRAALGARLAAAGSASTIAITVITNVISMRESWADASVTTFQWLWWAATLALGVGLVLAALRRPVVAIGAGVLWLAMARPPVFESWFWKQLIDHPDARYAITCTQLVLQGAIVLLLAGVAVADVPDGFAIREPQRIRSGLARIAGALWLRLIALVIIPLVTIVVMGGDGHNLEALSYTTVAAGFVAMVGFLGLGLGALEVARSNRAELHRTPFYAAAAGSLWCAGVTLYQLPQLYRMWFAERTSFLGERAEAIAGAFPLVLPLVAAVALVAWAIGVERLAIQRQRIDLSERAQRTAIWFVLLSFANVAIMQWLLPEARSDGAAMLVLLLALVCGVVALVGAASLARDTAELGNVEQQTIPTATML